ncbi:MAG: Crp/Fnr family transcriptional regulator [Cyanobacteria bacterium P01_A01_bin.105]
MVVGRLAGAMKEFADVRKSHLQLLRRLGQLVPLNAEQQENLCAVVKAKRYEKGDCLLDRDAVSDKIFFVVEGILRSACDADGKEITRWFCFPNHFATAYFSFVYRQPSEDCISAVTTTHTLSLSYVDLQQLSQQDAVWIDLNRRLLEYHYTTLLDRVMSFQSQSAKERYHRLLISQPDIEEQVPLGYLASFLGMSQETLSRLRAKYKAKP